MSLVSFDDLMREAERGRYAVGYFETWDLESLMAVADAAESTRSPVILGFSGIYLVHPERVVQEPLAGYAALGLEVCRSLSVPTTLLFNESPDFDAVLEAVRLGFPLVMYADESVDMMLLSERVRHVVDVAHAAGVAVEGEATALPGVGGDLVELANDTHMTDPAVARAFVEATGVDALAVNVGQMHLHGRRRVRLDLDRLAHLERSLDVPLVLHGATSIHREDLVAAIQLGVRKINVGSVLKQTTLKALRDACVAIDMDGPLNVYEAIGSGLPSDVLVAGRLALQHVVEEWMALFGSAGRA
jgi:fructose/tagatose bisphosphate aldolase